MLANRIIMSGRLSYAEEVLADSPISYWQLNETSGTTAFDSVGVNNGTYTGGYTLGQPGIPSSQSPSTLFNGTSGYVDLGAPASLNITSSWAWEIWAYLTSTPVGVGLISESYTGSGDNIVYALALANPNGTDGSLPFVGFHNSSSWKVAQAGSALSLNAWHHIVGKWDGTTLRLYIDRTLVASSTPGVSPTADMDNLRIGRRWDAAGNQYFPGRLAHAAIYSSLSEARIFAHYDAGTK